MSTSPPQTPPPPPPLVDQPNQAKRSPPAIAWRTAQDEAALACQRASMQRKLMKSEEDYVILSHYQETPSILQEGPKCGLVALCMLAEKMHKFIHIDDVLSAAVELGITKQGEMFSANRLCDLANQTFECHCETITTSKERIIDHLKQGKPLLIPYDADFNHEPCLKNGHKAHWAAIIGIVSISSGISSFVLKETCVEDNHNKRLFHVRNNSICKLSTYLHSTTGSSIYVYAKHGKSKHLSMWSIHELIDSNNNLMELDPIRAKEIDMYVLPSGGIKKELCSKVVLIHP